MEHRKRNLKYKSDSGKHMYQYFSFKIFLIFLLLRVKEADSCVFCEMKNSYLGPEDVIQFFYVL